MNKKAYSLSDLAEFLSAEFSGDAGCTITDVGSIDDMKPGQICFLKDSKYSKYLDATKASVVIVNKKNIDQQNQQGNLIFADDPYLAYAKISSLFDDTPKVSPGIHSTAQSVKSLRLVTVPI